MTAPENTVFVQGQGSVSASALNTMAQWVPTVTVLRTFIGTSTMTVLLLGTNAPNDGGQGVFYWDATSTAADNGYSVIVPSGVTTGAWIRNNASPVLFPSSGTVAAACGGNYVATGAITLQLAHSTTLTTSCVVTAFAYGGTITLSLASATDRINGGTVGASLVIPQGYSTTISTDANGNFYATVVLSTIGGAVVAPGSPLGGAISGVARLTTMNNTSVPNTQIDITAGAVLLANMTGQIRIDSFSGTLNAALTGANGLDTGALAASTWYYLYIIAGVTSANAVISASLLSLSATAPTLPTGYTIAERIGAYLTDGSVHFYRLKQRGEQIVYVVGTNPTTPRLMTSGVHGNPATPTWFAVSVSTFVPPTAAAITLCLHSGGDGGSNGAAPNNQYDPFTLSPMNAVTANTTDVSQTYDMTLESGNVYYVSDHTNSRLECIGWIDNF